MEDKNKIYLNQIIEAAQKILKLTTGFKDAQALKEHEIASDAVIFNFAGMIDAVNKLDKTIKEVLLEVQWNQFAYFEKQIADIRFQFDMEAAWEIIQTKLPHLIRIIQNYLETQKKITKNN